ncbi:hypothetical protein BDV96DRAFT_152936 [Lophiotrema nucula]|uniref:Uncharacterized protein n=1 Tax=Lophiotrema nucula TaxID=690887 RepID=A0A6A5Z166_9PLEO|nr:hypothetical protein BDV96DRAFT_152936 [Lophiotrema nucula]
MSNTILISHQVLFFALTSNEHEVRGTKHKALSFNHTDHYLDPTASISTQDISPRTDDPDSLPEYSYEHLLALEAGLSRSSFSTASSSFESTRSSYFSPWRPKSWTSSNTSLSFPDALMKRLEDADAASLGSAETCALLSSCGHRYSAQRRSTRPKWLRW